jgi:sulfite exporter TauE/SafE
MKTLYLPIILVSGLAVVGMTELLWLFANNSQATLELRFSHTFFNIFTLVPFSIMGIGIAALTLVFRKKYISKIRFQIILFGVIVIFAGLGTFSLYLID